tara:strand:- start:630 stop:920 length:291 start_codon:yes stop_codon:yes gene_type:complete
MNKNQNRTTQADKFLNREANRLGYFRDRWEDEKDYEDFEEYRAAIKKLFEENGFSDVKVNKRFTINCTDTAGIEVEVRVQKTSVKLYETIPQGITA